MRTYGELLPKVADRRLWALPHMLRERGRTHAHKTFLRVPHESFAATYAQMHAMATAVASAFLARGSAPGDRVLIMAANGARFVHSWFGCAYAGMVELPINTAYVGNILEHQISTASPIFAVIDNEFAERFARSPAARATIRRFFLPEDRPGYAVAAATLQEAGFQVEPFAELLATPPSPDLPTVSPYDLAAILFTSGTTGPSKGAMMPHGQMHFFAESIAAATRLTENDVYMAVGPMFHGNSQVCAIYPALICGAEVVLREKFSASQWLQWIQEDHISVTNFIGVMMDFVWRQEPTASDAENNLRCILAIPTVATIEQAFVERFGMESFVEGFGNTELCAPVLRPYGVPRPSGAVGLAVDDWFDIRVADPQTGLEVPAGDVGEFLVRPKHPYTVSSGYFGMPEKTVETWRDLWWHSGDAVRQDPDGWFYFVDRLKDALRRRGENISSFEVEQPILEHAGVAECAVIGVPSGIEGGEDEVMAVIIPAAGHELTAEGIWEWCDSRLPRFAVPRYIRFAEDLPRTPTQKVHKVTLRAAGITPDSFDRLAKRT